MRVLLVEDEASYRELLQELLQGLGAEVVTASTAATAWAAAQDTRFDAALIDVVMPGEDGFALATRLKDSYRCRRVVLMSGYPIWWLRGRGIGTSPALTKPFSLDDLIDALGITPPARATVQHAASMGAGA